MRNASDATAESARVAKQLREAVSWTNDALVGITSLLREVEAQRDAAIARAERAEAVAEAAETMARMWEADEATRYYGEYLRIEMERAEIRCGQNETEAGDAK